jgi:multiple sugar transport system ATP-binding protein
MIAGLELASAGRIRLGDTDATALRPAQRDVGFVFQFYALYPHMTVRENLAFPLECSGVARDERARRVGEVAERLGLGRLLDLRPRALSGGDQQRVALGRAMVRRPSVWLMDEPLGTLDSGLRLALCEFLRAEQLAQRVTTVYVTHDQEEALRLADRIVVMSGGEILQADRAARVYDEPADLFVARFLGSPGMNLVTGEIVRGTWEDAGGAAGARGAHPKPPPTHFGARARGPLASPPGFTFSAGNVPVLPLDPSAALTAGPVVLGVRPEFLALDAASPLRGRIAIDEYLGSARCLHVDTPIGRLIARVGADEPCARGGEVGLRFDPAHVRLFEPATGRRIA